MSYRITRAFNRSQANRAVALHTSKVFDRVWSAGLLHKLKSYGISSQIFDLISSFFSNRQLVLVLETGAFGWEVFSRISSYCWSSSRPNSWSILMTFLMMLSVILLSVLMLLLSLVSVIRHLICGNNLTWLLNFNLIYETLWNRARSDL